MTRTPQAAGGVIRKIAAVLILVPLAIVIVAFAIANRQAVTISFDPFSADRPAASMTLPLFALVIAVLIFGVMLGGIASWLRHGRWRRVARRLEREALQLRGELESLKRAPGAAAGAPPPAAPPERLRLRAPVR